MTLSELTSAERTSWSLMAIGAAIALVLLVAPLDRVLGDVSRLVYLHGAMVWVALVGFTVTGVLGVGHLVTNRTAWRRWSQLIIHPDNPIGASESPGIKLSFAALVGLCGLGALLIARRLRPPR